MGGDGKVHGKAKAMTARDEIIRMARTALRLSINDESLPSFDAEKTILNEYEFLYWFAKEVAAAEREVCAQVCEAQENRVVRRHLARIEFDPDSLMARKCASAIRARGNV